MDLLIKHRFNFCLIYEFVATGRWNSIFLSSSIVSLSLAAAVTLQSIRSAHYLLSTYLSIPAIALVQNRHGFKFCLIFDFKIISVKGSSAKIRISSLLLSFLHLIVSTQGIFQRTFFLSKNPCGATPICIVRR